jgi:hypothetical protein
MPTFTFTNNSGFDVFLYRIAQSGTLIGEGNLASRETKTFPLDLPAGTELHFTTEMTMDLPSDGPVVYHDKGITVDTYRTTGADRQTHTLRNISTQLSIRNSSASPVFLFSVDPRSGNEVAAGSVPPHNSNLYADRLGALKPSTTWRIKNAAGAVLKTYVTTTASYQDVEINANTFAATANYTHVQFISWEVYTGPNRGPRPWAMGIDGKGYTGIGKENAPDNRLDIEGQIEDIRERVQFTYKAIEEAYNLAVKHPTTLKVFMAPEFLYRGKGGAYIHDVLNGWDESRTHGELFNLSGSDRFPGLFGYLKRFAADARFKDWLFVFGTAISASFPARSETNGKWVVDSTKLGEIYNTALIQHGGELTTDEVYASRKRYIASIDFIKSQYRAKNFTLGDVEPADRLDLEPDEREREGSATFTINGINDGAGQPIMFGLEVCLDHSISTPRMRWANGTVYAVGKVVISPDDGLRYTCGIAHTSSASPTTFTQDKNNNPGRWVLSPIWANSTVYAIDKVVMSPDDGLLYTCGIAHTSSASPTTFTQDKNNNPGRWVPYRNPWGRIRTADTWVKIQLIPSGGMELKPVSIRLLPAAGPTPHSYAFHCDGLATLWGDPNVQYQYGAHTQIWNGANGRVPVPPENQLINANYEQEVGTTSKRKVDDEIPEPPNRTIKASDLWDLGSGYVRVMQEMPL